MCIDLPKKVLDGLADPIACLKREELFFGSYAPLDNLHVTLKFIGELREKQLEVVKKKLSSVFLKSFTLCIGPFDLLMNGSDPRVVFITLVSPGISLLAEKIERVTSEISLPDDRPFFASLTVARVRDVPLPQKLITYVHNIQTVQEKFVVREFLLKESAQYMGGVVHTTIARYPLL